MQFKLNQYGSVFKQLRLTWPSKRSGIVSDNINYCLVGIYNGSTLRGSCSTVSVSYTWQTVYCNVSPPLNQQLNYTGGWNGMLTSIIGDGFGRTTDLLDVNYVILSNEP